MKHQLLTLGNHLINILGPAPYCTKFSRNFSIGISGFPIRFALLLTSSAAELTKYARWLFKNILEKPKLFPKLCWWMNSWCYLCFLYRNFHSLWNLVLHSHSLCAAGLYRQRRQKTRAVSALTKEQRYLFIYIFTKDVKREVISGSLICLSYLIPPSFSSSEANTH